LRIHAFLNPMESMSDPSAIDAATRRLAQALDGLAAAVERRREADRDDEKLLTQLQTLGADRSRLASELDHATARTREIETANREIARRLDVAMENIRAVIESHEQ
jgi:hypothetical protein